MFFNISNSFFSRGAISYSARSPDSIISLFSKETGKKQKKEGIPLINYNGLLIDNQQAISSIFNNYFSTIVEEIIGTNQNDRITHLNSRDQSNNISQNTGLSYLVLNLAIHQLKKLVRL